MTFLPHGWWFCFGGSQSWVELWEILGHTQVHHTYILTLVRTVDGAGFVLWVGLGWVVGTTYFLTGDTRRHVPLLLYLNMSGAVLEVFIMRYMNVVGWGHTRV